MQSFRRHLLLWGPAVLWMVVLFAASGTPQPDIPSFGPWDFVVKKGGHMLGYAVLALLYRRGVAATGRPAWVAWPLALLYAVTDEFHQSLVPGRHPAWLDVLLFDGGGAAIALAAAWIVQRFRAPEAFPKPAP